MGQLVNRRRRAIVGLASMFGGAACLVATIPGQASADPPGNNGTVKIDGAAFDDHPDNEPHVGCIFQVDWYGFDEGEELFSHVTFEVHPPTGKPAILLEDDVFIGEDDNSGGGSEAGLDASETYDLSTLLQGFEPHPQQGWHVKLTTNNDGSQGADVKHKVFWVSGCETPPTTTSDDVDDFDIRRRPRRSSRRRRRPRSSRRRRRPRRLRRRRRPRSSRRRRRRPSSSTTTSTTEQPTTTSTTEQPTTTSTTEQPTTTSTTEQPTTTSTTEAPTTSSTEAPTTSSSEATSTTAVAPSSSTTSSGVTPAGELPKTGGESQALLIAAGITLLVGGGALLGSAKLGQKRLA